MRNSALHDRLRAIAAQASARLTAALDTGAEIPFEVAENPGARSVLYHYRPLSDQFVRERFPTLRDLPSFGAAVEALCAVAGASAYLRVLGASYVPASQRDRAEAVLREFLARVWTECGTLELDEPRFERAYRELESIAYEDSAVNVVVAPVVGVRLAAERLDLGSGLSLVRGDLSDAPAEGVWASGREGEDPNTIVALTVEATPQEPPPLTEARMSFRKLLTALRLLKPGAAALGPHAWSRTDDGPWQAVPLGFAGRSRGNAYWLEPEERVELKELFELLRSRPVSGSLPWALARFEAGCEHPVALNGLSDHLLAARALLEGAEPTTVGVPLRMGALCAEPADRRSVQRRVEQAFHLERLVMRGDVDADLMAGAGIQAPEALVRDLETDLRALLRDAVCGHLPADLRGVADEILDESTSQAAAATADTGRAAADAGAATVATGAATVTEPIGEPRIRRMPRSLFERTADEPLDAGASLRSDASSRTNPAPDPDFVVTRAHDARRPSAEPRSRPAGGEDEQETAEHAVVPSSEEPGTAADTDWGLDDDAADYSAAV